MWCAECASVAGAAGWAGRGIAASPITDTDSRHCFLATTATNAGIAAGVGYYRLPGLGQGTEDKGPGARTGSRRGRFREDGRHADAWRARAWRDLGRENRHQALGHDGIPGV